MVSNRTVEIDYHDLLKFIELFNVTHADLVSRTFKKTLTGMVKIMVKHGHTEEEAKANSLNLFIESVLGDRS